MLRSLSGLDAFFDWKYSVIKVYGHVYIILCATDVAFMKKGCTAIC